MLLMLNNVSSFAVVVTCWWLVHSYAQNGGRFVAAGFALTGLSVLLTSVSRNVPAFPDGTIEWQIVITKVFVAITLSGLIVRQGRREITVKRMMRDTPPKKMSVDCLRRVPDAVGKRRGH